MNNYQIKLIGCDDETVFYLQLSDEQALAIKAVQAMSLAYGGAWKPTLEICLKSDLRQCPRCSEPVIDEDAIYCRRCG